MKGDIDLVLIEINILETLKNHTKNETKHTYTRIYPRNSYLGEN